MVKQIKRVQKPANATNNTLRTQARILAKNMTSFLGAVFLLLAVLALSSTRSFSSRVGDSQDENIPRHYLVNSFEYPEKIVDAEEKDLRELAEDVLRGREREREKEKQRRLEREREEERKWRNELRRERERERNRKHETRGMNAQGFSPDTAIPLLSEHDPESMGHSRGLGKHREREEEIQKERTDHHGRKEEERIHKMERERLRQRKINGKMRQEFEKEMKGHRQRLTKIGNQFREQEERFRARSRARGGISKILKNHVFS